MWIFKIFYSILSELWLVCPCSSYLAKLFIKNLIWATAWRFRGLGQIYWSSFREIAGYAAIKGSANFGGLDGSQGELSPPANRLKTQISFSPRLPSSLGMLSQISEDGTESLGAGSLEEDKLGNGNGDARFYGTGFPFGSWNDSSNFTDNFGGLRRDQESNRKLCSSFQVWNFLFGCDFQVLVPSSTSI